jgi:hypothetical protein
MQRAIMFTSFSCVQDDAQWLQMAAQRRQASIHDRYW